MGEAQHLTGLQPCTASQMLHKVKHTGWRVAGMVGGSNHFCIQYARKPPTPDTTSQVTHWQNQHLPDTWLIRCTTHFAYKGPVRPVHVIYNFVTKASKLAALTLLQAHATQQSTTWGASMLSTKGTEICEFVLGHNSFWLRDCGLIPKGLL